MLPLFGTSLFTSMSLWSIASDVAGQHAALSMIFAASFYFLKAAMLQVFFENGIRVAIIGTGWGVKVQVPQFRAAGINIFAIFSREQKKCAHLAVLGMIITWHGS